MDELIKIFLNAKLHGNAARINNIFSFLIFYNTAPAMTDKFLRHVGSILTLHAFVYALRNLSRESKNEIEGLTQTLQTLSKFYVEQLLSYMLN